MNREQLKYLNLTMPAEWEDQEAVLMAFPHENTDWGAYLDDARRQFARIIAELTWHGDKVILLAKNASRTRHFISDWFHKELGDGRGLDLLEIIEADYNDTWTRDYGPLSVVNNATGTPLALDFGFNAWGLKFPANLDNQVNANLCAGGIISPGFYMDCRDIILEGGSIESDGYGTLLTTSECLLSPNRNPTYSRPELEEVLKQRLGVNRVLWLDHGHIAGDDTDSHIDTLCRFAPYGVILYTAAGEPTEAGYEEREAMFRQLTTFRTAEGRPYHLVELPLPDPIYDEEGNQLAATYANFLVTPGNVYVPSYGQPRKDRLAAMTVQSVYHDRRIIPVDCRTLIRQGGSLHCSTMQLYPGVLRRKLNEILRNKL